jgi:hypothetical protein
MSVEIHINKLGMGSLPPEVLSRLEVSSKTQPYFKIALIGSNFLYVPTRFPFTIFDKIYPESGIITKATESFEAGKAQPTVKEQFNFFSTKKVTVNKQVSVITFKNRRLDVVLFGNAVLIGEEVSNITQAALKAYVPVPLFNNKEARARAEAVPQPYLDGEVHSWIIEQATQLNAAVDSDTEAPRLGVSGTVFERKFARSIRNSVFEMAARY